MVSVDMTASTHSAAPASPMAPKPEGQAAVSLAGQSDALQQGAYL